MMYVDTIENNSLYMVDLQSKKIINHLTDLILRGKIFIIN